MRYLLVVEEAENNFSAYFPDVLGCIAAGDTLDETVQLATEALAMHLEGDEPPFAKPLLEHYADGEFNDLDVRALVWVDYEPASPSC